MLSRRSLSVGVSERIRVVARENAAEPKKPTQWSPPLRRKWRATVASGAKVRALATLTSQGGVLPEQLPSSHASNPKRVGSPEPAQSRLDASDVTIRAPPNPTLSNSPGNDVEYARSEALEHRARASVERLAMAEPPGREPVNANHSELGEYYNPKVGDYVIGTVASGSYYKLDIDIGAKRLALLLRRDAMPLDVCNVGDMSWPIPEAASEADGCDVPGPWFVYDEEVLNLALEEPTVVEKGTVFTLQVKGFSPSGAALLSARSVACGYAWQRVRQLYEQKAILKVEITQWTNAGLVAKIEGLRAFLPFYHLVNRPPEPSTGGNVSNEAWVGQVVPVMITGVDEIRSSLVISEKAAWISKNAYIGALVTGVITDIHTYGVHVQIKNTDLSGILHISNISRARIDNIECLFCVGEQVRVMVVPSNIKRKLSFSTADLELEDGLMLRDKEAVYRGAEKPAAEIARAHARRNPEPTTTEVDDADGGEQEMVIANWNWLDFVDQNSLAHTLPD